MKTVQKLAVALLLIAPLPAHAQVGQFWNRGAGPQLTGEDTDLLSASVARLNAETPPRVGASEAWRNPATGSHGTTTVTSLSDSAGAPCHGLRHEFFPLGRTPTRTYDFTWCRTADGSWKIKS